VDLDRLVRRAYYRQSSSRPMRGGPSEREFEIAEQGGERMHVYPFPALLSSSLSLSLSLSSIRNSRMLDYGVAPPRVIVFRVVLIVLAGLMGGLTWFGRDCRRASSSLVTVGRIPWRR